MSMYDDPGFVADILQGAIDSAEEFGRDGYEVGLVVLKAAVRHLRRPQPSDGGPADGDA